LRTYSYIVLCGFLFWGCQEVTRPERPDNLIDSETMVGILVDAYLGNAARSNNNRVLYAKYGIDSLQMASSTAYYAAEINSYLAIMDQVESRLSLLKKELDSLDLVDAEQQREAKQQQGKSPQRNPSSVNDPGLITPVKD
jgi:hypothetical protein